MVNSRKNYCLSILLFFVFCSHLFAAEYEVKPGDDVDAAISKLKPGDVLNVAEGIYTNGWTISGIKGTKEAPIVIKGKVSIDGDQLSVTSDPPALRSSALRTEHGLSVTDDINSSNNRINESTNPRLSVIRPINHRDGILFYGDGGSRHVVIENIRIENALRAGIVMNGSRNIVIRNCVLADNGFWGIQTCLSDYISIENCDIYGSGKEHGIYFSTTDHPVVRNCRIHDNASCGIQMNGDESEGGDGMISGGVVEGNLIYRNGDDGGSAINMDGVEKTTVANNRVFDNYSGGIVSFCDCGAQGGDNNRFLDNVVCFRDGDGRFGLRLIDGSKNSTVKGNTLVCGKGPALEVDKKSISGLKSDNNKFFVRNGKKPIKLGWIRLSLEQWQDKTEQDKNSSFADIFTEGNKANKVDVGLYGYAK